MRVHCIGIGGIGVSALAKWLKAQGVYVSGSDAKESEIAVACKQAGMQVWFGEHPEKMGTDIELVVYSGAVPLMHEERIRGRHLGAREVVYNQLLGELSSGKPTVAVTGTKGKSSTTAMIGLLLEAAGLDPTVVVGAKVPGWKQGNLRLGNDALWVVEACEHQAHMMHVTPSVAVLTNVAWDHPDFYPNLAAVEEAMVAWIEQWAAAPSLEQKVLVWNAGDAPSQKVYETVRHAIPADAQVISFGEGGDVSARVEHEGGVQRLIVQVKGEERGPVLLRQPGAYSVQNALATIAVGEALDIPFETTRQTLEAYRGIWRRFERLGAVNGVEVYTDYAHNPMSVRGLLEGAKAFFPGRRIVCVYEPHQHARTRELLADFVPTFDAADAVVLAEIYGVKGREEQSDTISSAHLADALLAHDAARAVDRPIAFVADAAEAIVRGLSLAAHGDVLLCVGAGTIDERIREHMKEWSVG
jgi:UDP-N-acetylmuramate--alanine ligase